ncbi:MAG: hypothetical protein ABFE07_14490 [Armatimonadia bacterium]
MSAELDLQELWKLVNGFVKTIGINRSLWEATAAAKPLAVDEDTLVLGFKPAEMRLSGYLTTPANKVQIEGFIAKQVGRRLSLQVIEGDTPEAWEKYKERLQAQVDHTLDRVQFRSDHKGALGIWETLAADMHKMFTETQQRRFADQLARLLIRAIPIISEAEDKAREAEPEAEQVHFIHLNRAFDKLSTYTDIPAPIVALEYLRYKSSRKKQQG